MKNKVNKSVFARVFGQMVKRSACQADGQGSNPARSPRHRFFGGKLTPLAPSGSTRTGNLITKHTHAAPPTTLEVDGAVEKDGEMTNQPHQRVKKEGRLSQQRPTGDHRHPSGTITIDRNDLKIDTRPRDGESRLGQLG